MKKFALPIWVMVLLLLISSGAWAETKSEDGLTLYRIHLGQGWGEKALSRENLAVFIDEEITPRFPDGLTVTEGRGQWNSPQGLVREHTTIVDVQPRDSEQTRENIEAIAKAYLARHPESGVSVFVVRVPQASTTLYY